MHVTPRAWQLQAVLSSWGAPSVCPTGCCSSPQPLSAAALPSRQLLCGLKVISAGLSRGFLNGQLADTGALLQSTRSSRRMPLCRAPILTVQRCSTSSPVWANLIYISESFKNSDLLDRGKVKTLSISYLAESYLNLLCAPLL